MLPSVDICESARRARDPRFDGRFIVAVVTTGIFCRPVCPARTPAAENVRYFVTPAAAQEAGYRPCRRCRPEQTSTVPAWTVGSGTVIRALDLVNAGFLNEHLVADLAARLGVGARQLNRLFREELGASPKSVARMQRLQVASRLIEATRLPFAEVALASGFKSVRRFNDEVKAVLGAAPRTLRRSRARCAAGMDVTLELPLRPPYNADWVMGFLAKRALHPLERVEGNVFERRVVQDGVASIVRSEMRASSLAITIPAALLPQAADVLSRMRRIFDLDADPVTIDESLAGDPILGPSLRVAAGMRVPGAWDGLELAVRAILGQQVSVARARELAVALVARYGDGAFPAATTLAEVNPGELGMPRSRGEAIRQLAERAAAATIDLSPGVDPVELRRALTAVPGIGPWTAEYVAMRVGRDPDAFPDSDWVVLKQLGSTPAGARKIAAAWRPWRAYALMYLWHAAGLERAGGA